ncbi:uncharacterized protein LOC111399207 isoform X2 [Olea europaea var. sylvestris]|uniref:uncharacterized protein LOC111399207 isoform X2 n=1 Tax=Olea europaea var. sylvestris TaxID=158386 RepID=UPI000C1D4586|nr:uncharacterized protein LOC111399207 isoform X2 [Olea europaea var. sylvestris]
MHLAALTNQPQVMKSLIKIVHVNKKNLEGKTALDILNPEIVEARKILISAGAKEGSSLVDDATSCENYLKSTVTTKEVLFQFGAYLDYGLSGNMQNAILVVAVLIATAAFQATLSPPYWISGSDTTSDTTPDLPNIKSDYNDLTSTYFIFNILQSIAQTSIIFNAIAFGLAMGTCAILTLAPLHLFLWPSHVLFSISFALLAWGIYPGISSQFIPGAVVAAVAALFVLPILIILPWKIIVIKRYIKGDIGYEYNLDETKYLIYGSTFTNQGLILNRMAKRKASQ